MADFIDLMVRIGMLILVIAFLVWVMLQEEKGCKHRIKGWSGGRYVSLCLDSSGIQFNNIGEVVK